MDQLLLQIIKPLAGAYRHIPNKEHYTKLPSYACTMIEEAYRGLGEKPLIDYHIHVIGTDTVNYGNFIHSNFLSWKHPLFHLAYLVFQSAFGFRSIKSVEADIIERLVALNKNMGAPWKFGILAFAECYDENGMLDTAGLRIHVKNNFIFDIARQYPQSFIPIVSIHPYRKDALEELEKWSSHGVKIVKWLPNAMGINPADPRCYPFYRKMQQKGMILLSHAGHESTLQLRKYQHFGNPLLLRAALDSGVRVIFAHCASLGSNIDLDHPQRNQVSNFELFMRLAQEPSYQNYLFGDIAAVAQINRVRYLKDIINEAQKGGVLDGKLVNGSDYPLPAINCLICLRQLVKMGLLESHFFKGLKEIYNFNPILFDFVLKRMLRHPTTHARFPLSVFCMHEKLKL